MKIDSLTGLGVLTWDLIMELLWKICKHNYFKRLDLQKNLFKKDV